MTLTKADLAETLFEKVGLNQRESKEMVEGFFNEISDCCGADWLRSISRNRSEA